MSWALVAGAAITVVGGAISADAAKDGADAQVGASNAATAEQRRQYDLTRADQKPFLDTGYAALERQNAYLNGDMSGFMNSAQYQAALKGGTQAINRGAIGNLSGGGTAADLMTFGQDNATRYGDNYWNKLAGQTGQAQSSAQNLAGYGANMANNIGQNYMNAGNARASSYASQANTWNNVLNQGVNLWGQYQGGQG